LSAKASARLPFPLDRDRSRSALDLCEVIGSQLDVGRAEVLLKPVEFGGAGDRHDPRLLSHQHLVGHIETKCFSCRADAASGKQPLPGCAEGDCQFLSSHGPARVLLEENVTLPSEPPITALAPASWAW